MIIAICDLCYSDGHGLPLETIRAGGLQWDVCQACMSGPYRAPKHTLSRDTVTKVVADLLRNTAEGTVT